ncbi:DUF2909 domain-containing protein [Gallaecimonas sp. GXIMD4217]|uniref:DUF2909 domain-containing protein n=1 Tax=Gallaecimonas sp. GXIMD4217 TaxID=3131927 RepID=UPI00311AD876
MIIKLLIVALLGYIIFTLFRALLVMNRQGEQGRISRFLGRRVLLSALVLVIIIILLATGLITPNPRPY